ncbi:MAG: TrbI/VirB10 family protein [Sphingomicrobium sp.]
MNETIIVKRPVVAREARQIPIAVAAIAFGLLGIGVFAGLSEARAAQQDRATELPPLPPNPAPPAPDQTPIGAVSATTEPPPAGPAFFDPNRAPPVTLQARGFPTVPARDFSGAVGSSTPRPPAADGLRARLNAPALVVDLALNTSQRSASAFQQSGGVGDSGGTVSQTTTTVALPPAGGIAAAGAGSSRRDDTLSDTEQFSNRVGNAEIEVAHASRMARLDRLVPQGAVIGATMETALNSDLPGYARALVQRNVYSFDGSAIMIPAGSRVIGQYKSGVAQGASRVFILWTRLIRPDGVTIDLASPATDELGRGGVAGKVNRHFFQRFGGAILTSILSGGITAAAAALSGGSTIVVGSASQASSLAGQASQSADIPPTITTRQGAAVRIFVARDLDFSAVGPAQ